MGNSQERTYYSQLGQDKHVLEYYSQKKDGYFVEIGAYDGVAFSNTYALELLGWKGICVEPLPSRYESLVKNRTCKTYNLAVDKVGGQSLEFVVADMLSGDLTRIDKARVEREYGLSCRIQVPTMNFTDLLDNAGAPNHIEFLSLDTEGSEYDILLGLDFKKYSFGYITVEHNFQEPARSNIKSLLLHTGYTYKQANKWDDDYILTVVPDNASSTVASERAPLGVHVLEPVPDSAGGVIDDNASSSTVACERTPLGVGLRVLEPVPCKDSAGVIDVEHNERLVDVGPVSNLVDGSEHPSHVPALELDMQA